MDKLEIAIKALREIVGQGRICPSFAICKHKNCRSSYTAWDIADKTLRHLTNKCSGCERIKMNNTTKEDFEKFKKFTMYWIDFFGLRNWEVEFDHKEDDTSMAYTTSNVLNRNVTIVLAMDWGERKVTDEELDKTAFHEVCEVLLLKIRYVADARYIMDEDIGSEIHDVIRILENVVWKSISIR